MKVGKPIVEGYSTLIPSNEKRKRIKRSSIMKKLLMFLIYTAIFTSLDATEIADIFSDNMILQRNTDIAVWGKSRDDIKISVSFAGIKKETVTKNGKWQLSFPAMKANKKPQSMIIQSSDSFEKVIKNILIGDVRLASVNQIWE